jgi:glyoxylase-like metal-dependent hydrolase (beta-lactamase superfamily II)
MIIWRDQIKKDEWFFKPNAWGYPVKVVLTIAHLDHDPGNNAIENTPALCQLCHNRHDAKHRAEGRKRRRTE